MQRKQSKSEVHQHKASKSRLSGSNPTKARSILLDLLKTNLIKLHWKSIKELTTQNYSLTGDWISLPEKKKKKKRRKQRIWRIWLLWETPFWNGWKRRYLMTAVRLAQTNKNNAVNKVKEICEPSSFLLRHLTIWSVVRSITLKQVDKQLAQWHHHYKQTTE